MRDKAIRVSRIPVLSVVEGTFRARVVVICLCLFALHVAVYSFTFGGIFSTDDEHVFLSGAHNLVTQGQLTAPQIYGNLRVRGNYGPAGDVEPAQAALGSLFYRYARRAGLGAVQTLYILNIWLTALAVVVVFILALHRRYSLRTALTVALLFGLGSIAWPYAKTFFRDTLAMLMVLGVVLAFELAISPRQSRRAQWLLWLAAGVLFLGGLTAKNTAAAIAPALGVALLIHLFEHGRATAVRLRAVAAALVAGAALAGVVFLMPRTSSLGRASLPYYVELVKILAAKPHDSFWEAVVGALVSPGKGIFFYSPITFLALGAPLVAGRRRWRELALTAVILLSLISAQGYFYDWQWWGHINWGLRFTLPAVPLLVLATAPIVERLWDNPQRGWLVLFGGLAAASVLVQIGGLGVALIDYYLDLIEVNAAGPYTIGVWNPYYSPIVGHWQQLLGGHRWDFAWVRVAEYTPQQVRLPLGLIGGVALLAALGLWRACARPAGASAGRRMALLCASALALVAVTAVPHTLLRAVYGDPEYFARRADYAAATQVVNTSVQPGDAIVVRAYGLPLWRYFFNYNTVDVPWYSLAWPFITWEEIQATEAANDPSIALEETTVPLLQQLSQTQRRVWIMTDMNYPYSHYYLEEWWLARQGTLEDTWTFVGPGTVRVSVFAFE